MNKPWWFILLLAGHVAAGDAPAVVPRAVQPGPPMLLGTSVGSTTDNQLVKSLGFSHVQTDSDHLTVNEPSPGQWDWTNADAGLAAAQRAGLKWQYFPHFHWPPEWYRQGAKFVPSVGLRSGRKLAAMSIWSPDVVPWFNHCYAALAAHYGRGADKLFAIYLGIHGDFGETLFPMGWHPDEKKRFGENGVALPDFWCGDDFALNDFRKSIGQKYGRLSKVNQAWGTQFTNYAVLDFPPAARRGDIEVGRTPQDRRYWLDFIAWYDDSMTRYTAQICKIARHYFPQSLLEIPVGGGSENLMLGQDTTALPKIARRYGVHVRSTHGGYAPFPQGYAAMIKRIATPCKIYGVPHWLEPPGGISAEGEVSRIMEALSCGNYGFWDWGANPVASPNVFRDYTNFFTREKPVVDVALFFPTTDHRLHPIIDFPQKLQQTGAQLRDVMDFDMVDEELIADAALKHYRVLVWPEGKFVEAKTLKAIRAWVKHGGVLLYWGGSPPETVEGDTMPGASLLGLNKTSERETGGRLEIQDPAFLRHVSGLGPATNAALETGVDPRGHLLATLAGHPAIWAVPRGKGWVITCAADNQTTFNELARDVVYNLSKLDARMADALEVDTAWDGVYCTLLTNGEVILHNFNTKPVYKTVAGNSILLPPKSLRSILPPGLPVK